MDDRYGTLFLSHISEDINNSPNFSDGVPKEGLRIQDVLVRLAILHLIHSKVKAMIENPSMPLFADGVHTSRYHSLRNTKVWKEEHDRKLLYAISKYSTFFVLTQCTHQLCTQKPWIGVSL
jgi:chromodomain-helicase-DNA-binding protein 4